MQTSDAMLEVRRNFNALVVIEGNSAHAPDGGVMRLIGVADQGEAGSAYILKCPVLRQQAKGQAVREFVLIPTSQQLAYLRNYLSDPYLEQAENDATRDGAAPEGLPIFRTALGLDQTMNLADSK